MNKKLRLSNPIELNPRKTYSLFNENKKILSNLKIAKSLFAISKGLMFSSYEKIDNGLLLILPTKTETKFAAKLTNLFVFHPLDCIFLNSKLEIVDKTTMNPFQIQYSPKKPCKYIIESSKNKFKNLQIGDKIQLIENP